MNIAKKILLGYGLLLILFFIYLVYALSSLDQMDRINAAITRVNQPLYELTGGLAENLLGQEFYSQRLLILKNHESFELLQMRFGDFDNLLKEIDSIKSPFASVQEFYAKCTDFRILLFENYGSLDAALAVSEQKRDLVGEKREELIDLIKRLGAEIRQDQNSKIELSEAIGTRAYRVLSIFGIGSVFIAVGITFYFARSIASAVGQLKLSTRQIADSKFDEVKCLKRADEFGDVSRSISDMARKIEHLEKLYLATNPLTLLPGGLAIDDTLKTRLDAGVPTALCIIDLDNFKVFNDRYGYARGNEVIQATAMIITAAVKESGATDDFIGHIGGDDFIVVTSPERYEDICKAVIRSFDDKILSFYDEKDTQRGAIVGVNRQGAEVVFPLMTISIAVVTDQGGSIKEPHILSRRAAELKEHAKSMSGSVYAVDKRRFSEGANRL
jgi:diguanylate cyclase (GGDEF)-like protein